MQTKAVLVQTAVRRFAFLIDATHVLCRVYFERVDNFYLFNFFAYIMPIIIIRIEREKDRHENTKKCRDIRRASEFMEKIDRPSKTCGKFSRSDTFLRFETFDLFHSFRKWTAASHSVLKPCWNRVPACWNRVVLFFWFWYAGHGLNMKPFDLLLRFVAVCSHCSNSLLELCIIRVFKLF